MNPIEICFRHYIKTVSEMTEGEREELFITYSNHFHRLRRKAEYEVIK